jgi:Carboxylesterase family
VGYPQVKKRVHFDLIIMHFTKYLTIAIAATILPQLGGTAAPTVTVKNGTYSGIYDPAFNQDVFLGIPFAQPPNGTLRLRAPESLDESWQGVREAVTYGNSCPAYAFDSEYLT